MSLLPGERCRGEPQGRMMPTQDVQVKGFVIGGAGFPAAIEDANPFVGQGTNGGMMRGAALPPLLVVGLRPKRLPAGSLRKFVKNLAQEVGASHPPMHPVHLAARFRDRSDLLPAVSILQERKNGCLPWSLE